MSCPICGREYGGNPTCECFEEIENLRATVRAMTETAAENSRVHIEMHNRIVELERTPIKCIWCGLRMATVDEAAGHVLKCMKGPWVDLEFEVRAWRDRFPNHEYRGAGIIASIHEPR